MDLQDVSVALRSRFRVLTLWS